MTPRQPRPHLIIPKDIVDLPMDPGTLAVYVKLLSLTHSTGCCDLPMAQLAAVCGMGETSLREKLKNLAVNFMIEITPQWGEDGCRLSNIITILEY